MYAPSTSGEQLTPPLDLQFLPGVLLGIEPDQVNEEFRPGLEQIQEGLYLALYDSKFDRRR